MMVKVVMMMSMRRKRLVDDNDDDVSDKGIRGRSVEVEGVMMMVMDGQREGEGG